MDYPKYRESSKDLENSQGFKDSKKSMKFEKFKESEESKRF